MCGKFFSRQAPPTLSKILPQAQGHVDGDGPETSVASPLRIRLGLALLPCPPVAPSLNASRPAPRTLYWLALTATAAPICAKCLSRLPSLRLK